jgi:hypothetical protein
MSRKFSEGSDLLSFTTPHTVVKGSWLNCAQVGTSPVAMMLAQARDWLFYRGGRQKQIASLHPRPSVCSKEPQPMGGDPIHAQHSRSEKVNFEI